MCLMRFLVTVQSITDECAEETGADSSVQEYAANVGWHMYWESLSLQQYLEVVPLPVRCCSNELSSNCDDSRGSLSSLHHSTLLWWSSSFKTRHWLLLFATALFPIFKLSVLGADGPKFIAVYAE